MSVPREIELKLELDPSAAGGIRHRVSAVLGPVGEATRRLTSVYYDTPKNGLRRRGLSLRVRQDGERRIQTLKADGATSAGLFDRPEWESEVADAGPDPSLFADQQAGRALGSRGPFGPIFETSIDRTTWIVEEGASRIEVVVDEGTVSAGDAVSRMAEAELELKQGSPADLFRVARRLAEAGPLRIGVRSKSERGYALLDGKPLQAVKAGAVALNRKMNAGSAFQVVARACISHFRLNETGLVETRAPEPLHQARVGMRRLRSALSLFKDVVADEEVEGIRRELRKLSRLLGEARNLDVYRDRVLGAEREREADEPGLAEFEAQIEADRERAYDRVVRKLGSKRFRTFMIDLVTWIEAGPWLAGDDVAEVRDENVWTFAAAVLDRRRRKVRKKGRRLNHLDPAARHLVRIEAKKLRYASEFFAALVKGGKAKRRHKEFIAALEELQTCLGDLNDIQTGHEMVEKLARAARGAVVGAEVPHFLFAAGHAAGEQNSREAALLTSATKAHRSFVDAKPFWS